MAVAAVTHGRDDGELWLPSYVCGYHEFAAVGNISGGFANTFFLMLAARVAEGLAVDVVQPIPAIITRNFGTREQGQASGICGISVMLSPAIGPSIGGCVGRIF